MTNRPQRVRKKLQARSQRPRLSVFVSNQHVYAQVIDDRKGNTIAWASDSDLEKRGKGQDIARKVGQIIAKRAQEEKIKEVVFDRGGRKYHGRVKELAQGAREGGLKF